MGLKLVMNILPLFLILSSAFPGRARELAATGGTFDVTAKYGAKAGADITTAIANAFKDACASTTPSVIVVPKGTYKLKEASFKGPCKAPIEFQIQGILQAPEDGAQLTSLDTWVEFGYLNPFKLTGGGTFDGQGALAWKQNDCHKNTKCSSKTINLRFNFVKNALVKDVTTLNSKNFHVNVLGCENFTFDHFTVTAPDDKVSRNTDGIHVGRSNNITIIDSNIGTGDDCISIGDGTKQLHVTRVTCGPGHGISIGSLGRTVNPREDHVTGIFVKDSTITGTSNGVRIKTWPDSPPNYQQCIVSDVHFENITMNNVGNPVVIDQEYCPWNLCNKKNPSKVKLSDITFKNIKGTSTTPQGVKIICAKGLGCDKVVLDDIDLKYTGPANQGPLTSECANVQPTITRVAQPLACSTKS